MYTASGVCRKLLQDFLPDPRVQVAATVSVVSTADQLELALAAGDEHVEIVSHLDLRSGGIFDGSHALTNIKASTRSITVRTHTSFKPRCTVPRKLSNVTLLTLVNFSLHIVTKCRAHVQSLPLKV